MAAKSVTFTGPETKLILICFKHMEGLPKVDWDAVAEEYGYKDGGVARSKFNIAKSKCKSLNSPEAKNKRKADDDATPCVAKRGCGHRQSKAPSAKVPNKSEKNNTESGGNKVAEDTWTNRFHPINEPSSKTEEEI